MNEHNHKIQRYIGVSNIHSRKYWETNLPHPKSQTLFSSMSVSLF